MICSPIVVTTLKVVCIFAIWCGTLLPVNLSINGIILKPYIKIENTIVPKILNIRCVRACRSVISPAFTKPTVMTVVALLLCMIDVMVSPINTEPRTFLQGN